MLPFGDSRSASGVIASLGTYVQPSSQPDSRISSDSWRKRQPKGRNQAHQTNEHSQGAKLAIFGFVVNECPFTPRAESPRRRQTFEMMAESRGGHVDMQLNLPRRNPCFFSSLLRSRIARCPVIGQPPAAISCDIRRGKIHHDRHAAPTWVWDFFCDGRRRLCLGIDRADWSRQ